MRGWRRTWSRIWSHPWRWRGPRWTLLLPIALVLVLGLGAMVGSTVVGIVQGMQETVALRRQSADIHYRRGLTYMHAGQKTLALAEFQETLRLNPGHVGAQREVLALLLPTPTPVPTPTANPQRTLKALLDRARLDLSEGHWQQAYMRLEQLRGVAPTFHEKDVKALLYQAAFNEGMSLLDDDRLEEALRAFDRALRWRPDAHEAQRQRDLISAYILGTSYFYVDWDSAIAIFKGLYTLEPNFKDVRSRYIEALRKGAEHHLKRGHPCRALNDMERLQSIAPAKVPQALWQQAHKACTPP